MNVPETEVLLSSGEKAPLKSLYAEQRMVLVFLRHLGCIFCKEHVAQLRRLKDVNIVFVAMAPADQTEAFRQKMQSPHRFICDPGKALYEHFELPKGGLAQVLSPQVFVRAIGATLQGHANSRAEADPMQLPGVFIVDTDGAILWSHKARHAADNPTAEEIEKHLHSAN